MCPVLSSFCVLNSSWELRSSHSRFSCFSHCESITPYHRGINETYIHKTLPLDVWIPPNSVTEWPPVVKGNKRNVSPDVVKCCGGANLSSLSLFTNVTLFLLLDFLGWPDLLSDNVDYSHKLHSLQPRFITRIHMRFICRFIYIYINIYYPSYLIMTNNNSICCTIYFLIRSTTIY